mmetsp:Transcript_6165/g.20636  ORF Transcript_6165/g.20636 Transcript_6165/m.20636 type:complete len:485 (+) Transcript_6165:2245-3699(+)
MGTPKRRKSWNTYAPGPYTIRLVWYPNGLMKDALAANINRYAIWSRSIPTRSLAPAAIGYISAAAALFPTMLHRNTVATYTAMRTPGLPAPMADAALTSVVAIALATPVFSIAALIPNAAAIVVIMVQFTDARAASWVKHPHRSITPDARSAATNKSRTPATVTIIISNAVPHAGKSLSNCGGAEFSISETSANAGSALYNRRNELPVSNSKTSPACNTISPIFLWIRPPLRCTAMITASYRVRNRTSRICRFVSGLPIATTACTNRRSVLASFSLSTCLFSLVMPGIRRKLEIPAASPAYQSTSSPVSTYSAPGAATASFSKPPGFCTAVRNKPGRPRKPAACRVLPSTAPPGITRTGHVKSVIARMSSAPSRERTSRSGSEVAFPNPGVDARERNESPSMFFKSPPPTCLGRDGDGREGTGATIVGGGVPPLPKSPCVLSTLVRRVGAGEHDFESNGVGESAPPPQPTGVPGFWSPAMSEMF